jgi:histidinol phosphatase-like PHP family hydrolase
VITAGYFLPVLTNSQVADLLAAQSDREEGHRRRALVRAARGAMMWEEEVADVLEQGRRLTELPRVGPWVAHYIESWLAQPPFTQAPPIRRGFLTLTEVRAVIDANPSWRRGLRADLQMHTTYTDGKNSLRDMTSASAERGYEFIAITDHSKGLPIARGFDEETMHQQGAEIDQINRQLVASGERLRVLRSLEMNLSPEGEGDMDPKALASLDLVLGAFHSKLRLTEDQTDRYLKALANPSVHVLAHPRGRRFNVRVGLSADWRRVLEAATSLGKAVEIDAYPDRQDLNVDLLRIAAELGTYVSIGTDAHTIGELRYMEFGLGAAIIAGLSTDQILNFMTVEQLFTWAKDR